MILRRTLRPICSYDRQGYYIFNDVCLLVDYTKSTSSFFHIIWWKGGTWPAEETISVWWSRSRYVWVRAGLQLWLGWGQVIPRVNVTLCRIMVTWLWVWFWIGIKGTVVPWQKYALYWVTFYFFRFCIYFHFFWFKPCHGLGKIKLYQ